MIARRALKLDGVLQHDDALLGKVVGDFPQNRIRERRLAAVGTAGDQDVVMARDRFTQRDPICRGQDTGRHVLVERVYDRRRFANRARRQRT